MSEFIEGTPVAIVRLDKPREVAFTIGALQRVRDKLGTLDVDLDGPEGLALLPTYLWACLSKSGRKELSHEDIADMIHPGNMEEIAEAMRVLHRRSHPEVEPDPTPAAPAAEGS